MEACAAAGASRGIPADQAAATVGVVDAAASAASQAAAIEPSPARAARGWQPPEASETSPPLSPAWPKRSFTAADLQTHYISERMPTIRTPAWRVSPSCG
eukprot:3619419-Prymnesium_polylepis.1